MSVAYEPRFAMAITHVVTETKASAKGVAARSTPVRKMSRDSVAVIAVTRTGGTFASR